MKRNKIISTVTAIVAVTVIICSIIIAAKGMGLVEGYDFGIGAYYYADIPGFEKIMNDPYNDTYWFEKVNRPS